MKAGRFLVSAKMRHNWWPKNTRIDLLPIKPQHHPGSYYLVGKKALENFWNVGFCLRQNVWQKNLKPQRPPKLFAASSTMLYFFETVIYLKGHIGRDLEEEVANFQVGKVRSFIGKHEWCWKKPEVGSDLSFIFLQCFYILFPKNWDGILFPKALGFCWDALRLERMSNFWGGFVVDFSFLLPRVAAPWSAASGKRTTTALSRT